jgi:hypothetical protein
MFGFSVTRAAPLCAAAFMLGSSALADTADTAVDAAASLRSW